MRYCTFRCVRQFAILLCAIILTIGLFGAAPGSARPVFATGSTWTVNDTGDSATTTCQANAGSGGPVCQLRDAMNKAASGDTINFSVSGTIPLSSTLPY